MQEEDMFVQIIEGRTSDAEGLKRKGESWQTELRPGATGYLGSTSGVASDGRCITIVRFESEAAARANSDRPEQGAWFADMQKYYDGEPTFSESSDVTELLGGGSDDAGFVQVMKSAGIDRAQMERLDAALDSLAEARPDLIGSIRIWTAPDACVVVAYFTSEAEARVGEKAELPAEAQALMAEFGELMANTDFIDLPDPQIH
jgi:hypothetical protein